MCEMNLLETTKVILKSLVISSTTSVTIDNLNEEYKSTEGRNIPYSKLGYSNLKSFLQNISDTLRVNYRTGIVTSKHVLKLVSQQRSAKMRPRRRRYHHGRYNTNTIQSDSWRSNNIPPAEFKSSSTQSMPSSTLLKRSENRIHEEKEDNVVQAMSSLDINSSDNSIKLIGTGYSSRKYGKKIPTEIIPDFLFGGDAHQIHVSEVASPWKFWFHLVDREHSLHDLEYNLNSFYSSNPQMVISEFIMQVGYACAAFHRKWMRAEIIAKPHNGMVKLLFVDFGTIDDVSTESIQFLMSDLCIIPRKCFRGTLDLIEPINEDEINKATLLFCEAIRNGNESLFGVATNIDENNTITMVIVDTSLPNEDVIVNQLLTTNVFPGRSP